MKTALACLLYCLLSPTVGGQAPTEIWPLHIVTPIYVLLARQARLQGTVNVEIELAPDGKIISAKGSGAQEVLDHASEQMVRDWVFSPAATDPVRTTTFTFVYKLKELNDDSPPLPGVIFDLPNRVEIISYALRPDQILP